MAKRAKKRGLVLEGGGAKGAYQFGCLKAFAERGLSFETVAGTSVGALNAFLWSSGSLSEGEDLYRTMRQESIYPFRMSRFAATAYVPLAVIAHAIRYTHAGARQLPPMVRVAVSVGFVAPYLILAAWFILEFMPFSWGTIYLMVGIAGSAYVAYRYAIERDVTTIYMHFLPAYVLGAIVAWSMLVFVPDRIPNELQGVALAAAGVCSFIVCMLPITLILSKAAFLTAEPLRRTVRNLASREIRLPTYATVALVQRVFDPANPTWQPRSIDDQRDRTPMPALEGVPRYIELSELDTKGRVDALLASAALPFGIVPPVSIGGNEYVDGGVADNSPVYPLAFLQRCDEVVLIKLKPYCGPTDTTMHLKNETSRAFDNSPKPMVDGAPRSVSLRALVLAPRSSLGNFITGTLNFSTKYSNKMIEEGYGDAIRFIDEHKLSAGGPP